MTPTRTAEAGDMYDAWVRQQAEGAASRFMAAANRLPTIAPLYVLADEFNTLLDLVEDPATDPVKLEMQLAEVTRDIKAKAFGIAEVIRTFERRADDYKREQDRLYAARKVLELATERLKTYTVDQLQIMGIDRIDAGIHTLRLQQNPISVKVIDEPEITRVEGYATMPDVPAEYVTMVTVYKVSKRDIAAHTKDTGELVAGISYERGVSLRVS